jgi:hypothetical protein
MKYRLSKILWSVSLLLFLTHFSLADNSKGEKPAKSKSLPPGLQLQQQQGKPLPPGWQKKLKVGEILDPDVRAHGEVIVPLDPRGFITIKVDDRLIRLNEATQEIIEILSE